MVYSAETGSIPTAQTVRASTHTPGPWSVPHFAEPDTGCECGYVLTDGYCGAVATVHASGEGGIIETGDNPRFSEAVANAHLISAAPELLLAARDALKALRLASRQLTEDHKIVLKGKAWGSRDIEALEAAIAKAKGQ